MASETFGQGFFFAATLASYRGSGCPADAGDGGGDDVRVNAVGRSLKRGRSQRGIAYAAPEVPKLADDLRTRDGPLRVPLKYAGGSAPREADQRRRQVAHQVEVLPDQLSRACVLSPCPTPPEEAVIVPSQGKDLPCVVSLVVVLDEDSARERAEA
jgi:hypothetical protein